MAGMMLSFSHNVKTFALFEEVTPSLPSRLLDRNNNLITELFSDEKRSLLSVEDVSNNLILALTTREDSNFFEHTGFSVKGTTRALVNAVLSGGRNIAGGSTITQQIAGYIYADRREKSIKRKIAELWWAWNMEKHFSKEEILENYLNYVPFGLGTYGIESASQFFFEHSASEMTPVESAILVIQLSRPAYNSPYKNPETARKLSTTILHRMVDQGYLSASEMEESVENYWTVGRDWTRSSRANAFTSREDKAPYFTEYVRSKMLELLEDDKTRLYKGGLTIYSTLDLDMQLKAEALMTEGLASWNKTHSRQGNSRIEYARRNIVPVLELLGTAVNLEGINLTGGVRGIQKGRGLDVIATDVAPTLELLSPLFGIQREQDFFNDGTAYRQENLETTRIQGALITLDNKTGGILAVIGGAGFSTTDQFNRAIDGKLQPGSTFKPLFYSEAISSHKFTPATHIKDVPRVFYNDEGEPYQPQNFLGELKGDVLLRSALANSMNIPAVYVLSQIGFGPAIKRAADLLGVTDPEEIKRNFPAYYPLALGVISLSPIQLARAYATFPERGVAHDPYAINLITSSEGEILYDFTTVEAVSSRTHTVLDQASAYVMVNLLQTTVQSGTLRSSIAALREKEGKGFDFLAGGKTGTTQNWADAWTAGFSPLYTTVLWAGFDKRGNSLYPLTGATATGRYWARYFQAIHEGVKNVDDLSFALPDDPKSIIYVDVSAKTGLLPTKNTRRVVREIFIRGTEPKTYSRQEDFESEQRNTLLGRINSGGIAIDDGVGEGGGDLLNWDGFDPTSLLEGEPDYIISEPIPLEQESPPPSDQLVPQPEPAREADVPRPENMDLLNG